jgi:Zn-dependent peptidase ImmA (M78 family)/transcriptional regulator with XRE-family HTH domain
MKKPSFEGVPAEELGERLRLARESAKINQANAASAIEVARTTLLAMEQGQRRVRIDELQKLAKLYGTSVNLLLRREAVHVDLEPRFRKLSGATDSAVNQAVKLLSDLAKAEVELENLLGVKRVANYPPERPLLKGDVVRQAEEDAAEFRLRMGLGAGPILDLVTLLEFEIGARVYVRRLDSQISGLFAFDFALGPCILLNANHPRERRRQSAAHETGHFVCARSQPEILLDSEPENSREERYANTFGRALLAPSRAVMQKFHEVIAGADRLTRRHVIVLAYYFGISREAMVRRLEELGLTKPGTWDWFKANGGITDEQARQVLGDLVQTDTRKLEADRPTTLRLNLLAAEAYRKELLSEGQLAQLLHIDRVELREIVDEQESEGSETHGALILPG